MKKIILAATATVIATLSFASASQAGHHHWNHGPGLFGGLNIVLDAGPRYVTEDYEYVRECYVKKVRKYNRYGDLVIRKVRICD